LKALACPIFDDDSGTCIFSDLTRGIGRIGIDDNDLSAQVLHLMNDCSYPSGFIQGPNVAAEWNAVGVCVYHI
jgi:hypothetical protein